MSMTRMAVHSALWSAAESWGVRGISALVFLVLARLLDAEAFGLMTMTTAYILVIQMLTDQGFASAIIQRPALEPEHSDSAFWANAALGVALGALTFALAGPVAALYGEPRLAPVLRWLAIEPPLLSLIVVQQGLLRRDLRFKSLTLRRMLGAALGGALGIVMAAYGLGVWSLVAQMVFGDAVGLVVLWSVSHWRPRLRFSIRHLRELSSLSLKVLGTGLLRIIGFQADRLLIGYFLGAAEVGYYGVAQRVLLIVSDLLAGSFEKTVLPVFAKVQNEPDRIRRGLFMANRILSFVAFPAYFGVVVTAPEIASVGLGSQWAGVYPIIQLLSAMSLCFALSFFFGQLLTAVGRAGWQVWVTGLNAAINIGAILIGVRAGAIGVAAALAGVQIVMYFLGLAVLRRAVPFAFGAYFRNSLVPLLAAAAMAAVVWGARHLLYPVLAPVLLLASCIALGVLVYGLLTWIAAPQIYREILGLMRDLRQRAAPIEPAQEPV